MKSLWLVWISLIIAGCSFAPTREAIQRADYGEKPNDTFAHTVIKESLVKSLIDPDSLKLGCAESKKGWLRGPGLSSPHNYGWVIYCEVNAKNRLGGYTGAKPYVYLFRGNQVIATDTYGDAPKGIRYDYVQ